MQKDTHQSSSHTIQPFSSLVPPPPPGVGVGVTGCVKAFMLVVMETGIMYVRVERRKGWRGPLLVLVVLVNLRPM